MVNEHLAQSIIDQFSFVTIIFVIGWIAVVIGRIFFVSLNSYSFHSFAWVIPIGVGVLTTLTTLSIGPSSFSFWEMLVLHLVLHFIIDTPLILFLGIVKKVDQEGATIR